MRSRRIWLGAAVVLMLGAAPRGQTPAPAAVDYGAALRAYVVGHDAAKAALMLGGLTPPKLWPAAEEYLATRQASPAAAATLHLEIAVGVVTLSTELAQDHLTLAQQFLRHLQAPRPGGALMSGPEFAAFGERWFTAAASAFLMVNDPTRARPLIERGLRLAPASPDLRLMAGIFEELVALATSLDDARTSVQQRQIQTARTQGFMRARARFEKLLADRPGFTRARIRLGRVLWMLGERDAALVELLRAQSETREPEQKYLVAMFLGALYEQQGNVTGARVAYEAALAAAPRSQAATVALGHLDVMAGRPDRAQALARTLLAKPPVADGWWSYKNGGFETAALAWLRHRVWQ